MSLPENKNIIGHPLDMWQSQEVLQLLLDFYIANFIKAGLAADSAKEFVLMAWNNQGSDNYNKIRRQCDKVILHAKKDMKLSFEDFNPLDLFDLNGVETYLDIGANKLNTINYYTRAYPEIKEFIAVDVIAQKKEFEDPSRSRYYQIDEKLNNFPLRNNSVDFINIQYVLHHFADLDLIRKMLAICAGVITKGGTLLLWEETFKKDIDLKKLLIKNNQLGINTNNELTNRFYQLSEAERWEFILVNDWLINVSNSHMPWTGQYYIWSDWVDLLKEYGFELVEEYNFGLRLSGRLKQGVQIIGRFGKV